MRSVGRLPEDCSSTLRARAYAQWRGIEDACSNRRWLTWSRDLRKLAALGEEKTDEEIANEEHVTDNEQVALVHWEEIRDRMEEIREVISKTKTPQKWETLLLLLDSYGVSYEIVHWDKWTEILREYQREKWQKIRS